MAIKRKRLLLDQSKIDRARRVLGLRTERATIECALEMVIAEASIVRTHERLRGVGGFADVFDSCSFTP